MQRMKHHGFSLPLWFRTLLDIRAPGVYLGHFLMVLLVYYAFL